MEKSKNEELKENIKEDLDSNDPDLQEIFNRPFEERSIWVCSNYGNKITYKKGLKERGLNADQIRLAMIQFDSVSRHPKEE